MISIAPGSRVLVHGTRSTVPLRSLRAVELAGDWSVAVLGDLAALASAGVGGPTASVEFATEDGPIRLDAELITSDGVFLLRAPGLRAAALVEQRREDVRAVVRLPLRGTVLTAGSSATRSGAGHEAAAGSDATLSGVTRTVSGGGVCAELRSGRSLPPGATVYLELELPAGDLAPVVATVISSVGPMVRVRFVDISPLDRERLVRLVFTRQRAELADRRVESRPAR